jgi:hypothetical protein
MAKAKAAAKSPDWKDNKWVTDLVSLDAKTIAWWERDANGAHDGWSLYHKPFTIPPNESKDRVAIYTRPIKEWFAIELGLIIPHRFVGVTSSDGAVKATYSYDGTWHHSEASETGYVTWFRRSDSGYSVSNNVSGVHVAVAFAFWATNEGMNVPKGDCCSTRALDLLWEAHKLAGAIMTITYSDAEITLYPNGTKTVRPFNVPAL